MLLCCSHISKYKITKKFIVRIHVLNLLQIGVLKNAFIFLEKLVSLRAQLVSQTPHTHNSQSRIAECNNHG